jgi:hypothetical protein
MKKTLLLAGLIIQIVQAQETLTPPPTRIVLPSDTARTSLNAKQKLDADSTQMRLPDVVVTGQDKSLRQAEQKRGGRNEGPRLINPSDAYAPLSIWTWRSQERQCADDPLFKKQMSWFAFQAGSYSSIIARLGHWHKLPNGLVHGHGWYEQSNGQFNNSGFGEGGAAASLEYGLTSKLKSQIQFQYNRFDRELHGAVARDGKRNGGWGDVALNFSLDPRPLTHLQMDIAMQGLSVNSDSTGHQFDSSDDFYYNLGLSVRQVWSKLQISADMRYLREAYDSSADSASALASFSQARLDMLYPLTNALHFGVGLAMQTMSSDSLSQQTTVAPSVQLRYRSNDRLAFAVSAGKGLHYQPFLNYWQENRYLSHRFPLRPEESHFNVRVEGEARPSAYLHFNLILSYSDMEKLLYWQRDRQSGFFQLCQAKGALSEIHLRCSTTPSAHTQVGLGVTVFGDYMESTVAQPGDGHVPYRPDIQMALDGALFLKKDWTLKASIEYWGKRYSRYESDSRLPGYALLHAGVQKAIGRFITASLSCQNLVDSKYVLWEEYPETGFSVLAGLRAQF